MKILFVISSINSKSCGLGGHYNSLIETADQLTKYHEVVLVNIGNRCAKALETTSHRCIYIIHSRGNILATYHDLSDLINRERPDILHAFDNLAYFWVRLLSINKGIKCCMTKCGGINPIYSPIAESLILYSSENLEFYRRKYSFRNSNLALIPNRIRSFPDDSYRIGELESILGENDVGFRFLRISRIGEYYQNSALQFLRLINALNMSGIKCCAIFVGTVEDTVSIEKLRNIGGGNTFFFLDKHYTTNAKEIINCADAVLGTGRSFMEAASKGKLLLAPVAGWRYPAMITSNNFHKAFYYNFSERTHLDNESQYNNYLQIKETIMSTSKLSEAQYFSYQIFKRYFNSDKIAQNYENVYSETKLAKKHWFDIFIHTLFLLRAYYK